jgi:hypothetical protein|tara:strand:+ start:1782 stop:1913 length:132 start_codon:yes stop_codon:yes gene_type:complete
MNCLSISQKNNPEETTSHFFNRRPAPNPAIRLYDFPDRVLYNS